MKVTIHCARVEHRSGEGFYLSSTEADLYAQLYAYVAQSWNDFIEGRPIPKSHKAAVSQYFDVAKECGRRGEFLERSSETVELEIKDLVPAGRQRSYVVKRGLRCPYCDSNQIEPGGKLQLESEDDSKYTVTVSCLSCNKRWTDVYDLVGFREDK